METLANFFDWINNLLGVSSGSELIVHPVFLGFCLIIFLYAVVSRQKFMALAFFGLLVGSIIYHYLYPKSATVELHDLLTFLAAMGGLVLVIIYFGFIRE